MTLDDLVIKHLRELLRLEDSAVKGLLSVYREESKRLLDEIELTPDDTFRAQYLRQILAQIEAGVQQMEARVAGRLVAEVQRGQEAGIRMNRETLVQGFKQFPSPVPVPSPAALEAVYAPIINLPALRAVREASRLSTKRWAAGEITDVQRVITKGILEYKTPRQIRRELEKVMGPKMKAHEIERIAKTEFWRAANHAQQESLQAINAEFPDLALKKTWNAILDGSCKTNVCPPLDKETVPVHRPFSNGEMHPPLHPRCRCWLTTTRKGWDKFKGI